MTKETEEKLKDLMNKALEESDTLDDKTLFITTDMLNEFTPAENVYGMTVKIGKEFAIKDTVTKVVQPVLSKGEFIPENKRAYVFEDRDGKPFITNPTSAWEMFEKKSVNTKQKYLGCLDTREYYKIKKQTQEAYPISQDVINDANVSDQTPEKTKAELEIKKQNGLRKEMFDELFIELLKTIDTRVTPANKSIIYADNKMSASESQLARQLMANR